MAIIKAISSRASLGTAINYVKKEEKTEERLVSGKNCSPVTAIDEMKYTKELYNKTDKRQYYHFVQSFSPKEKITLDEAHKIAKELADKRFEGYEVVIATHKDKEHIHTHFVVNSVNAETGYKLDWSKYELQRMKNMSDEICKSYEKSICEKNQNITTKKINEYKAIERGLNSNDNYKSYKLEMAKTLNKTLKKAKTREEFISEMNKQGYNVKWKDNNKYITIVNQKNEKQKARTNNLAKTFKQDNFTKEGIINELQRNRDRERRNREQQSRNDINRTGENTRVIKDIRKPLDITKTSRNNQRYGNRQSDREDKKYKREYTKGIDIDIEQARKLNIEEQQRVTDIYDKWKNRNGEEQSKNFNKNERDKQYDRRENERIRAKDFELDR